MDNNKFQSIINEYADKLKELESKKVFLVTQLTKGGLLSDKSLIDINAKSFTENSKDAFEALINSDILNNYKQSALIDFAKACNLYLNSSTKEEERIKSAIIYFTINKISIF